MFTIPADKQSSFIVVLEESGIPPSSRGTYLKWVRYYIDFCQKYKFTEAKKDSLSPFVNKLRQKRQTIEQQNQAYQAVTLYLGLTSVNSERSVSPTKIKATPKPHNAKRVNDVYSGSALAKIQVPAGPQSGSPAKMIHSNSYPKNGMPSKAQYVEKPIKSMVIRERTENYSSDAKLAPHPTPYVVDTKQ